MRLSRNPLLISALSATIKARRLQLDLTQEALAGQVDLDRPYITLMEAGKKQPTVSVLWRLAGGLQMTVAELATAVDERLARLQAAPSAASKGKAPVRRTR
jgi:transcriptional regulator with XRE-family HTH domain